MSFPAVRTLRLVGTWRVALWLDLRKSGLIYITKSSFEMSISKRLKFMELFTFFLTLYLFFKQGRVETLFLYIDTIFCKVPQRVEGRDFCPINGLVMTTKMAVTSQKFIFLANKMRRELSCLYLQFTLLGFCQKLNLFLQQSYEMGWSVFAF